MSYAVVGSNNIKQKKQSFVVFLGVFLQSLVVVSALSAEVYVVPDEYVVQRAPFSAAAAKSGKASYLANEVDKSESVASEVSALMRLNVARAQASDLSVEGLMPYDAAEHATVCKALKAENPDIMICEPNFVLEALVTPNDAKYSSLWGMEKIDMPSAWGSSTGSQSVVVAVIDTGVDYTHPDLAQNMWVNPGEIAGNGKDDDANGYIDDIYGVNVLSNTGNPYDDNSHGTHVSGTIGAVGNNGLGVAGVNWQVRIMGVKFLSAGGGGTLYGAVAGINYAVANGAQVINASWGGGGFSQALYNSINTARSAGVLFVAAAGNSGLDNDLYPNYPAAYDLDNIISVAATGQNDSLASFSNYGLVSTDIAAPGVSILSTVPGGGYASYSGTSMATPHVAGVAALVKAANSSLTYSQLRARILDGDSVSGLAAKIRTGKRLNAAKALQSSAAPGDDNGSNPAQPNVAIESLTGHLGTNKLYVQRPFNMVLAGDAGETAEVMMRLKADGKSLGSCSLGTATIGSDGTAQVSGTLRLRASIRSLADAVSFKVSTDNANRRLYRARKGGDNSKENKRSNTLSTKSMRRDLNQSCANIGTTVSGLSR